MSSRRTIIERGVSIVSSGNSNDSSSQLRSPEEFGRLQVNACRNPSCLNFGVPAAPTRPQKNQNDPYKLEKGGKLLPDRAMLCKACRRTFRLKSNRGVKAELDRISAYLEPPAEPACPAPECANHERGVDTHPRQYEKNGARKGSRRYKCKLCGRNFSVHDRATTRQRMPHQNRTVFAELVTKKPIRGIAQVTGLDPASIYDKIDFIHRQCLGFAGERERRLANISHKSLTICVDSQDYMTNSREKKTRKNIQFTALCSVDMKSGYVLAHSMNYDPAVSQVDVEDESLMNGDLDPSRRSYFRALPQYWLRSEFERMKSKSELEVRPNIEAEPLFVDDMIIEKSQWEKELPDPEVPDIPYRGNQMPGAGVMTHADYTAYAHALLVEQMTRGAWYSTIYMDQSTMLRNAFVSAFSDRIRSGRCEMVFVQFQKQMTIDEKRDLVRLSNPRVAKLAKAFGLSEPLALVRSMAWRYAQACAATNTSDARWVEHPRDTINEPRRRILYLTDNGQKSLENIGWVLSRATLAPVDNYFMRLRRKIYYLERPIPTRTNANRMWSGYHAYDPKRVVQLLDIFRVYTNYIWKSGKETPAMRLGLARGPVRFEDILYWMPGRRGAVEPQENPIAAGCGDD